MRIIKRIHKEINKEVDIPIKYTDERKAGWENPNPMSLEEFMDVDSEWSKMYRDWKKNVGIKDEGENKIDKIIEIVEVSELNSFDKLLNKMTTDHGRQEILRLKRIGEIENEKEIEFKSIDDRKIDVKKKKKRRR